MFCKKIQKGLNPGATDAIGLRASKLKNAALGRCSPESWGTKAPPLQPDQLSLSSWREVSVRKPRLRATNDAWTAESEGLDVTNRLKVAR